MKYAFALAVCVVLASTGQVHALPTGPGVFCTAYPDSPHCQAGAPPCVMCHTTAPTRNAFGDDLSVLPGQTRPLDPAAYDSALPAALMAIEAMDSDEDGHSNVDEIAAGTYPGNPESVPGELVCPDLPDDPEFAVCTYDPPYVLRKIYLDVCGHSPSYEQMEELRALSGDAQRDRLRAALSECLDSEFWLGKNGALWQLAHPKIRPVGSLKTGEDAGGLPISDYYDDYHLFVYASTDDRDVRDVLLADYYVARDDGPTRYSQTPDIAGQRMQRERRAGLLTTNWVMVYNVMFTALPRTAAAQAYRAFLGLDIARQEGLYPVAGEPMDYDNKGVQNPQCAVCHSTLDPLTYPFRNYSGFHPPSFQYAPDRLETHFLAEGPNIANTPEAGAIFGQPVADLREWAQTAASSEQFAAATVADYWKHFVGQEPSPDDPEFEGLWRGMMNEYQYSVEQMLFDLIATEAYGAP